MALFDLSQHPGREKFPELDDDQFEEEVVKAAVSDPLKVYLQQRAATLGSDTDQPQVYQRNETFPFPIMPTVEEIADVVIAALRSDETLGVPPQPTH